MKNIPDFSQIFSGLFGFDRFKSNSQIGEFSMPPRRGAQMRIDRFADELPYSCFDEQAGLCVLSSPNFNEFEGLGYVIEIQPQTGTEPLMAKSLAQLFGAQTPAGTGIQTSLFGCPYVLPLTNIIEQSCIQPNDQESQERLAQIQLLQSFSRARSRFLLGSSTQSPYHKSSIRVRNFRAWISVVVPCSNPFDGSIQQKVQELKETHLSLLNQWHLHPWCWNRSVLINTVSQILNIHQFYSNEWVPRAYDPMREPRYQCVDHDTRIEVHETGIRLHSEKNHHSVHVVSMSARSYAQNLTHAQMNSVLGSPDKNNQAYPCPFLVTTYAVVSDYEKAKAKAQLKSARAQQMAGTEIARFIPALTEEARDWQAAVHSFEESEGLLQLSHQVLLFCEPKVRNAAITAAKAVFEMASIHLSVDDFMHLQGLLVGLPLTGGPLLAHDVKVAQRCSTKTAANAAHSQPIIADWKGTGPRASKNTVTPMLSLVSRRGQLVHVDPFANPNGNYNGTITGASGAGKSNLLNEMTMGTLRSGGRVWIIDVGRSYDKLCQVLKGQWIELSDKPRADGKIDCLNPFSMVKNIKEDMDLILPLISQMVSPSNPLDDLMSSHLAIHFQYVWNEGRRLGVTPTLTDLQHSLLHNGRIGGSNPRPFDEQWLAHHLQQDEQTLENLNDPRVCDLGVQLAPYAKNGAYSSFFEGEANLNFDNHFIVLELEQLSSKKALQQVVLLLLMYRIELEMRKGDRAQSKLVIIDEAWDLMGAGHSSKFIEAGYRRARKLNGSFFTATQTPEDYQKSDTARAALNNADCVFMLRQKSDVLAKLEKEGTHGLSDYHFNMWKSLTTATGEYSEIMVKIGDSPFCVNRLILDPFSQLLMSTHPSDLADIERYKNQGLSIHKAIEAVLEERAQTHSHGL